MAQGRTSRREGVLLGVRGNAVAAFGPVGGDRAVISLSRGFGLNMLACEEAIDGPFEASSANGSALDSGSTDHGFGGFEGDAPGPQRILGTQLIEQ